MGRMPTHGRPKSRLGRLPRVLIGVGAVVAFIGGTCMVDHCASEYRWQIYRGKAQEDGVSLRLPEAEVALPKEDNLAAESPFAPVKVGTDGKPIHPSTLKNDLLPAEYLADVSRGKPADLAASGPQLQRCNFDGSTGSTRDYAKALLAACDRQMGAQWSRVLAAEARPEAQFNIRYWPMPMTEKVPVADFRIAVQTHTLRATALLHLGRSSEAVQEVRGSLRLVEALEADPALTIFMLRTALLTMPTNVVWEGLNIGAWTDADLVVLDGMFAEVYLGMGYAKAIETERGWINAVCNELAADPSRASSDFMKEWVAALDTPIFFPGIMHWKRATVRKNQLILNEHYEAVRERIDATGNWHGNDLPLTTSTVKSWRLAGLAMVDFSKTEGRVLTVEARLRQARLAIALERYRRKHDNLPSNLEALVPDYLPRVLEDPIDGEAMRYSRDASRSFRLWSIGDDHEDDQGVADAEMCKMTLDTVWPGTVPGRKPKVERLPDRGPRALRSITSSYAMAW